jgi:hypothetical protein
MVYPQGGIFIRFGKGVLKGRERSFNKRISFLGMELSNRTCKGKQQEVTGKLFEKETAGNRR